MPRTPVATKRNTEFITWWELAAEAFKAQGLPEPLCGPARSAYDCGESPETWAAYVVNSK